MDTHVSTLMLTVLLNDSGHRQRLLHHLRSPLLHRLHLFLPPSLSPSSSPHENVRTLPTSSIRSSLVACLDVFFAARHSSFYSRANFSCVAPLPRLPFLFPLSAPSRGAWLSTTDPLSISAFQESSERFRYSLPSTHTHTHKLDHHQGIDTVRVSPCFSSPAFR